MGVQWGLVMGVSVLCGGGSGGDFSALCVWMGGVGWRSSFCGRGWWIDGWKWDEW